MDYIFRGFYPDKNGTQVIVVNGKEYKGEWEEGDLLNKCSGSPKISIDGEYNRGLFVVDSYEVIPETVSQFTGLVDKNGKRIFENDRLKVKAYWTKKSINGEKVDTYWTVGYSKSASYIGFKVFGIDRRFNKPINWNAIYNAEAKVIGTIFDKEEV